MWVLTPILPIRSTMPAKVESTPALPGLSPVGGKAVIARFDGGHLSSDGGVLVLREVERRLDVAGRLAACIADPRHPERVVHGLDEIVRFRMLMIAAGLRRWQRCRQTAHGPDVQVGAGAARERCGAVLAIHHLGAGEAASATPAAAHGPGHDRSLLCVLPPGSKPDCAGRG